jgi:hypothetical protein
MIVDVFVADKPLNENSPDDNWTENSLVCPETVAVNITVRMRISIFFIYLILL